MSFSAAETSVVGRQRCRPWTPLFTQQLRLRHLYQIMGLNLTATKDGRFYYTLHLTSMCAPFYTSEKAEGNSAKWAELDIKNLPSLSVSAFVLRLWQEQPEELDDKILLTWGVNLSGLVFLGNSLPALQPNHFNRNTVIFSMRGGFFTSRIALKTDFSKPPPFIDHLNLVSDDQSTKVYRVARVKVAPGEMSTSYNVKKLQRLQSLQIAIRNKTMEAHMVKDKIEAICGLVGAERESPKAPPSPKGEEGSVRYAPQLLTMNSLNKMLQGRSTKAQRLEVKRISREIEVARFKTKLLSQEKDKKSAHLRHLKQKHNNLIDDNEERNSKLMENYHQLCKESERMKEWKKVLVQHKEVLSHCSYQLHHRRRQLLQELLFIYPIKQINSNKFVVHGVYLPNSDMLSDCSESGLAVALGYVTHILTMCSIFLQVPLRYPMVHCGSRSTIMDHISPQLLDRDRDFALFPKSRQDRDLFNYAVYLLNKNIAQLRLLCGLHTPDLKATLPNLLGLLQGKGYKTEAQKPHSDVDSTISSTRTFVNLRFPICGGNSSSTVAPSDPVLEPMKHEYSGVSQGEQYVRRKVVRTGERSESGGPGLSEILAIPEAFLNKEISSSCLKNYIAFERHKKMNAGAANGASYSSYEKAHNPHLIKEERDSNCGSSHTHDDDKNPIEIEQGTDLLSPSANIHMIDSKTITINGTSLAKNTYKKPISRSVGSYTTEDECCTSQRVVMEVGSDPQLNAAAVGGGVQLPPSLEDNGQYLKKWLDSGPAVCSEANLYPDEVMGTTVTPLTARTDALLNTKSFNLVKPKYP